MGSSLAARLGVLADAYEQHGYAVRSNLLPGATAAEIAEVESALGVILPPAYRQLYGWSAGTADEWGTGPCLWFRDMYLLPLSRVVEERGHQLEVYGELFDAIDFRTVAPLATNQGSTLAVACSPQQLTSLVEHPVICTFHELSVYFDSIERMVETQIAWVSQATWEPYMPVPHELDIWTTHNRAVHV
jgi:hypothetical protein